MKVRDLKKLLDRLDPEATVHATSCDLGLSSQEVRFAAPAVWWFPPEGDVEARRRVSANTNAVLLFVGGPTR